MIEDKTTKPLIQLAENAKQQNKRIRFLTCTERLQHYLLLNRIANTSFCEVLKTGTGYF